MATIPGDIIFNRSGRPVKVLTKDNESGEITTERDQNKIREHIKHGITNGLTEDRREAYNTILSSVKSSSKQEEVNALYKKIEELKASNGDQRLIRYLNGELQFRMSQADLVPENYKIEEIALTSY